MSSANLIDLQWYTDSRAASRGEPGIRHSYLSSLATVLHHIDPSFDPVWLMGTSAFAFRIWVNERFCPSAMSVFDWDTLLPEAVEQMGCTCRHIRRLWNERELEEERRREAHAGICASIDEGVPAVVWDVNDAEWGVVTGYDDAQRTYQALTYEGTAVKLPYDRLGNNGIDILSVILPGGENSRPREDIVQRSLQAAMEHAEQNERLDRSEYQDGLPAYDLWAGLCNRWAMLIDAGRARQVSDDIKAHAVYLAEHIFSARCYARDYLRLLAEEDESLAAAAEHYADTARLLEAICAFFSSAERIEDSTALRDVASAIRAVRTVEKHALTDIRRWLAAPLVV